MNKKSSESLTEALDRLKNSTTDLMSNVLTEAGYIVVKKDAKLEPPTIHILIQKLIEKGYSVSFVGDEVVQGEAIEEETEEVSEEQLEAIELTKAVQLIQSKGYDVIPSGSSPEDALPLAVTIRYDENLEDIEIFYPNEDIFQIYEVVSATMNDVTDKIRESR